MTSDPEISTSPHPETTTPFKDKPTALNELPLSPKPETPAVTQPDSLKLPMSVSPGTVELKASQNSSLKGPDALLPSARIAGPPAPLGSPIMHLEAPKDPYDLYFCAPDAWVPSHIATKQPPPTPPLPPKLPPPPRGNRPQSLESLSPATLPSNLV
ncbi:hypothetical protein GH733_017120 [Mirounga leonina]|nr:hypothetical protein GH733_017120 [Mirounga leonina]